MKILCLCRGGIVRSVALATELKLHHGFDALAAGVDYNSDETLSLLMKWADRIVVMEDKFSLVVPKVHEDKVRVCDVGPDRWNTPMHPDLVGIVQDWAADEKWK